MDRRERAAGRRKNPGLKAAIAEIGIAGIAKACGITTASVSGWERIPAERVAEVSKASGLSRHQLRPDLYERAVA